MKSGGLPPELALTLLLPFPFRCLLLQRPHCCVEAAASTIVLVLAKLAGILLCRLQCRAPSRHLVKLNDTHGQGCIAHSRGTCKGELRVGEDATFYTWNGYDRVVGQCLLDDRQCSAGPLSRPNAVMLEKRRRLATDPTFKPIEARAPSRCHVLWKD